jgi:hypothetical protein
MNLRPGQLIAVLLALARGAAGVETAPAAAPAPAPTGETNTVSAASAYENDPAFQRFTGILDRSPFAPAGSLAAPGASEEGAAFVSELKLTGFFIKNGVVEVSIEDKSAADRKYFVHAGEEIGDTGVKISGFDLQGRAVLLNKGEEQARLEYDSAAAPPPPIAGMKPGQTPPAFPGGPGQPGFRPPSQQPPPPTQRVSDGRDDGNDEGKAMRRRNRQQTIDRLKQMLEKTSDSATQERLRSMINMLERADAQDAASGGR